jgi:hypothetical protein
MRIIRRSSPVGASAKERNLRWEFADNFFRFWFTFVRPHQAELEAGADQGPYFDTGISPRLDEFCGLLFEKECHRWLRDTYRNHAPMVGAWWGNALNSLRRTGERTTEEVDGVALTGSKVRAVLEAKWTNGPMARQVYDDLLTYKLPALTQAGLTVVDPPDIVLVSRAGFSTALQRTAKDDPRVRLVTAEEILGV